MSTMWPDEYTGGSHQGATNGAYACPAPLKTVNAIIAELNWFTPEQRSLAWSPMPPPEPMGAHDCRIGGSCGLDFNHETRRSRWVQARFRWLREQKRMERAA